MQNDFLWVLHSMINDHLNRNEDLAEQIKITTQQNSYSISHLLGTVTTFLTMWSLFSRL